MERGLYYHSDNKSFFFIFCPSFLPLSHKVLSVRLALFSPRENRHYKKIFIKTTICFSHTPMASINYHAVLPGEKYRVLATSATLRKHMTDTYWSHTMEQICDGKIAGVLKRYTGNDLVLMEFESDRRSRSGRLYPISITVPSQYLVPCTMKRNGGGVLISGDGGSEAGVGSPFLASTVDGSQFGTSVSFGVSVPVSAFGAASGAAPDEPFIPHLCVVCGRWDLPGEVRRHGYKCQGCIGTKSLPRLRQESHKLAVTLES